jgi:hypothetical protein
MSARVDLRRLAAGGAERTLDPIVLFAQAVQQGRGAGRAGPCAQTLGFACRFAARPLRCSVDRPAAKLASLTAFVPLKQSPQVSARSAPSARGRSPCASQEPPDSRPSLPGPPLGHAPTTEVFDPTHATTGAARLRAGSRGGEYRDAREAQRLRPRAQRASCTDSPRVSERSERSERSEFRGGPLARASQGTRCAAARNGSISNCRESPPAALPLRTSHEAINVRHAPTAAAQQMSGNAVM